MQVYLDGRMVPADQARVSVFDGGYLYGDGVYTTLRLYRGRAVDLQAHWDRLLRHAQALDLQPALNLPRLRAAVAGLATANDLADRDARLRITISRGGDAAQPLPLSAPANRPPTEVITLVPIDPAITGWQAEGIATVVLGPAYARSHFPELKTLNGLTTILAQRQAARLGCQEALLTAPGGRLLEGAVSNLFLVRAGVLWTPCPEGHFLAGRTRERILAGAAELGIAVWEENLVRKDLDRADEVFVASSVREVLPVVEVDHRPVGAGTPGPVTRLVQEVYSRAISTQL